ncbi:MAG TPA: hypothetical protein VGM05_00965 [Planctomycetaceae bacterium]|jgi:hypothetical protein
MTQPNAARSDDDQPLARDVEQSAPQASGPSRELLEQVVRRTLAEQEGGEIPSALMSALHAVARRQRAQSQPWDSAAVELVEQMLETWFPGKSLTFESRRTMATEIADVLANDPAAGARLRRFWERLSEAAP